MVEVHDQRNIGRSARTGVRRKVSGLPTPSFASSAIQNKLLITDGLNSF